MTLPYYFYVYHLVKQTLPKWNESVIWSPYTIWFILTMCSNSNQVFKDAFIGPWIGFTPTARHLSVMWRTSSVSCLSTSTRGSASPLQTIDGHIDCPALDMLLRSISIYSRYPEKLAQGQSSAGATTPTTMFTTVGSAVASGLENQLIPTWTFSLLLNRFDTFYW